ncbi:MAG: endolytic transglycosylase MltG, partial [Candidatus Bathyarchaeia archaeon]
VIVPEGLDSFELASFLERERVIKRKEDFIKVVFDREIASRILKKYDLPGFVLEGYLFPGVYYFSDSLPSEIVAERMVKNFVKKALPEIKRSGKPLYELLIIASIVQKETYYSDEMPIVAGVFYNRLRRNMPLQADPTVIYARRMETSGKYKGPPKKADLTIDSPYNTYNRIGLPPTPISNPGIDAIRASINPAKTKYLYFVSMGNGTHFFSSDLNAHNRAVERFLKGNGEALKE